MSLEVCIQVLLVRCHQVYVIFTLAPDDDFCMTLSYRFTKMCGCSHDKFHLSWMSRSFSVGYPQCSFRLCKRRRNALCTLLVHKHAHTHNQTCTIRTTHTYCQCQKMWHAFMLHSICTAMYVHVHMYTWLYNQKYYNPIIYTICVRVCLTTFTDQMRLVTAPSKWPPAR